MLCASMNRCVRVKGVCFIKASCRRKTKQCPLDPLISIFTPILMDQVDIVTIIILSVCKSFWSSRFWREQPNCGTVKLQQDDSWQILATNWYGPSLVFWSLADPPERCPGYDGPSDRHRIPGWATGTLRRCGGYLGLLGWFVRCLHIHHWMLTVKRKVLFGSTFRQVTL